MNKDVFSAPDWTSYSKKLRAKIDHPQFVGFFYPQDVQGRGLRLAIGKENKDASSLALYFVVDETDGIICDIRYQLFGPPALIGAVEAACQLLLRKNYHQALRVTADLIDLEVRDRPEVEAFPREAYSYINLVLHAIENGLEQCTDIPFDDLPLSTPLHSDASSAGPYPGWETLSKPQKIALLEEVIHKEIRPYIELDAGGIQIVDLSEQHALTIAYEGSCTSCHSATGSTLNAIQQILQARIHPALTVIPDASFLKT